MPSKNSLGSSRPARSQVRPPEHPADDLHALHAALQGGEAFGRMVAAVVAVQAEHALGGQAEGMHAQVTAMQQGIGLAFDDMGDAAVDGQGGAVGQGGSHVVGGHAEADGIAGVDAKGVQGTQRQAQVAAGHGFELAVAYAMERNRRVLPVMGHQRGRRLGIGRLARARGTQARDGVEVLGAFAGMQPAAMHAEQVGDFVETSQGHAALEPVVDVLGRDLALGGKIGGGQVALLQEGFEAFTRAFHGSNSSDRRAPGI